MTEKEIVLNGFEALKKRKLESMITNWHDTKIEPLFSDPLFNKAFGLVLKPVEKDGKGVTYCLHFKRLKDIPRGSDGYVKFCVSELSRIMNRFRNPKKRSRKDDDDVESIACDICKLTDADDDNDMSLCDKCNKGYHMKCIGMTVEDLPEDAWFCDKCAKAEPLLQFVVDKRVSEAENRLRTEFAATMKNAKQKIESLSRNLESFRNQGFNLLDTVVGGGGSKGKKKAKKLAAVVPSPGVTVVVNGTDADNGNTKGSCSICSEKSKHVCLENLKSDMVYGRITTPSDPRRFAAKIVERVQLHKKSLCTTHIKDKTCSIAKTHKFNYCMVCRSVRSSKSEEGLCVGCADACVNMKRSHAQTKDAFEKCMRVMHSCVGKIRNITFYHEMSVGDACTGAVDTVMEILTTENKKLVFVIEFQNTHRENPSMLTHKLIGVCIKLDPVRVFLMNVRISSDRTEWKMHEKLDILRRWVIMLTYWHDKVPSRTYWEFFQGEDSPLEVNAEKSKFLSEPLIVDWAPKCFKNDWEFATDPYAGYISRKLRKSKDAEERKNKDDEDAMHDDEAEASDCVEAGTSEVIEVVTEADADMVKKFVPWHKIVGKARSVTELLGASFPKDWIGPYNVDQFDKLQHMQCKDDCEICKKFLGV